MQAQRKRTTIRFWTTPQEHQLWLVGFSQYLQTLQNTTQGSPQGGANKHSLDKGLLVYNVTSYYDHSLMKPRQYPVMYWYLSDLSKDKRQCLYKGASQDTINTKISTVQLQLLKQITITEVNNDKTTDTQQHKILED